MNAPVYLDWNASAPLGEPARAAMAHAFSVAGNPSSVHAAGRAARKLVEESRAAIASSVGAGSARLVFTGGGTEANALALNGFAPAAALVSAIEHDCVFAPLAGAAVAPVDANGIVDLASLERLLEARPTLVAVMLANNETGAIQPVAEIARLTRAAGARLHCDAVQAFGKIAVDFEALGCDTLALSAHKIGGPQGVGALVVRETVQVNPLLLGGGQEQALRAGTQNVAGIAGFAAAAKAVSPMSAELRDRLESTIRAAYLPATIHAGAAPRLPNTSCIGLPGVSAETQVMAFDLAGFAVSAGAACSSGKVKASRTLGAMGAGEGAGEAIRVSLGPATTADEIEKFTRAWVSLAQRLAPAGAKVPAAA
ncbi:MAG: cysteine desulfurase [Proteobacteria bacterium]|nr:cysteine desulfurase [Pseudomonadota bacterium]